MNKLPADWNAWKKRDEEFVDDRFEAELREALMASKAEYQENKASKPVNDPVNQKPTKTKPSNKKGTTMSLDQFNLAQNVQLF